MKKTCKIFLWIGFVIVAITVIICIAITIMDYKSEYQDSLDRSEIYKESLVPVGFMSWYKFFVLHIPTILVELIFIRNGCVFLTPEEPRGRKIRCIVSTVLALFVIIVGIVIVFNLIDMESHIIEGLILTFLPISVISLVVGRRVYAFEKEDDSL